MPLVSVVIPVHNGAKTIRAAIDSVLQQSLTDFELIVADDGSEDETLAVISSIADPRIHILTGAHAGANACRNRGLFHATGKYVSFLDADDLWTADKLEAQLQALQNHPEAAVAYSWTDRIDEAGRFLRRGGYISVSGNVLAELLIINFLENGSNPLILREAAIAVGGFDESLPACQDWDMWLRLAASYRFVSVPLPQVLYRVTANSVSGNVPTLEAACLKVIDRAFTAAPAALQRLRRYSVGNVYKYLLFKLFEGQLTSANRPIAIKFLSRILQSDPRMLRVKVTWKVFANLVLSLLPSDVRKLVLSHFPKLEPKLETVDALLAHLQYDFAQLI